MRRMTPPYQYESAQLICKVLIRSIHAQTVAICFTGRIVNEKLLLQSNGNIKEKCWQLPVTQKKSLAKAMLNKNVDIAYQPKEKNIVKAMKLTS